MVLDLHMQLKINIYIHIRCQRFHSCVSRTLVQMLQVHSDKPNLWCFAAKWEFEESQSVENARQFLLRGLRFHPESKVLYAEVRD